MTSKNILPRTKIADFILRDPLMCFIKFIF